MVTIKTIKDIDLLPFQGKTYFNIAREWREEFIYFLLVDRFHDDLARTATDQPGRSAGIYVPGTVFLWRNYQRHPCEP